LDEVVTLRLGFHGYQERLPFRPDLVLLGKIIGGGLPVGALAGRAELMRLFTPPAARATAAGTFSGNPVTMAAGLISLQHLTESALLHLNELCSRVESGLVLELARRGSPLSFRRQGSLLAWSFRCGADDAPDDLSVQREKQRLLHLALLNNGLITLQRGMLCTSTVMPASMSGSIADIFVRSLDQVLEECRSLRAVA